MAFIVLEGVDGAGKTTQANYVYGWLCRNRIRAKVLREPGGTLVGEEVRRLISAPRVTTATFTRSRSYPSVPDSQAVARDLWAPISPLAELFLFLAARAQLVEEVIRPSLARDITVVCDRYIYSTLAYQGYGRGLNLELLKTLNDQATGGLEPDLVLLMDVDPARSLSRKRRAPDMSRFEGEETGFQRRVREGYLQMAREDPARWRVIDANRRRKAVSLQVWAEVSQLLEARYPGIREVKAPPGARGTGAEEGLLL